MTSTNQVLQSFDPFATHPFTRYCSSTKATAPNHQVPHPNPPPMPKATSSPSPHPKHAPSSAPPQRSVFVPYARQSPEPPELQRILKKKASPPSSPPLKN